MKRASSILVSMLHSEPSIQCSNPHCQAYNELQSRFCEKCKTPVIKRYLWATRETQWSKKKQIADKDLDSQVAMMEQQGQIATREAMSQEVISKVKNRYLKVSDLATREKVTEDKNWHFSDLEEICFADRIFLDTQPGQPPQIPTQLPEEIISHLQLFSHFPYIPQVYGQLDGTDIWLLDYGTVPIDSEGRLIFPDLLPTMTSLWSQASDLRQVKWLRQIAGLWKPLLEKGMASTLLNPQLIRVNGSLIQLLELEKDRDSEPTLQDLGKLWQEWSREAHTRIHDVLAQLSKRVANGSCDRIEQIIIILERILDLCSQSHQYSYEVFSMSDSGPTRNNNQDTAYPDSENPIQFDVEQQSLAIVCDGVGGHEGGEIASQETVNYLRERVSTIDWEEQAISINSVVKKLIQFTNEANDAISQRNDSEQRQERQRMGTTLVMSLARKHEVYLTHIGDSRIYLITNNSCHQITIDDDLASREVRLGYAVYRDALRYPSAGALIQALGMRDSAALHPNIERLLIDDDCLLLLCSDGLSDFDRVDQYWRDVILPVLDGRLDIKRSVKTLIKIGNKRNGHDNITAALVHCHVKARSEVPTKTITWFDIEESLGDFILWTDDTLADSTLSFADTLSLPESIRDEGRKLPAVSRHLSSKTKSPFFSLIVALSITLIIGLGIVIHLQRNKSDKLPENSYIFP